EERRRDLAGPGALVLPEAVLRRQAERGALEPLADGMEGGEDGGHRHFDAPDVEELVLDLGGERQRVGDAVVELPVSDHERGAGHGPKLARTRLDLTSLRRRSGRAPGQLERAGGVALALAGDLLGAGGHAPGELDDPLEHALDVAAEERRARRGLDGDGRAHRRRLRAHAAPTVEPGPEARRLTEDVLGSEGG